MGIKPSDGCRLPITLRPETAIAEAALNVRAHMARAAACAENGFAVAVVDESEPFGKTVGFMITPELAKELVAEGRLKWIT